MACFVHAIVRNEGARVQFPEDDLLLSTEPPDEEFDVYAAKGLLQEFGDLFRSQLIVARAYSNLSRHILMDMQDMEGSEAEWNFARVSAMTSLAKSIRDGEFLPGGGGYGASFDIVD